MVSKADQASSFKLTTRGRYAVIAVIELAEQDNNNPVPLLEISEKCQVSLSYLEQLFAGLKRHNIVKSYRGPGGGYILARAPGEISISDIMIAAEDSAPARRDLRSKTGSISGQHPVHTLWDHIGNVLHTQLARVTLHDVRAGNIDSSYTS